MERRWLRDITRTLGQHGITVLGWQDRSKHALIKIGKDGKTGLVTVSVTPSDHRVLRNMVKYAKHSLAGGARQ